MQGQHFTVYKVDPETTQEEIKEIRQYYNVASVVFEDLLDEVNKVLAEPCSFKDYCEKLVKVCSDALIDDETDNNNLLLSVAKRIQKHYDLIQEAGGIYTQESANTVRAWQSFVHVANQYPDEHEGRLFFDMIDACRYIDE